MSTPSSPRSIELLVPARNVEIGFEAIRHGADAVYLGASDFGARHQAANSVADIARLCAFAHIFGARIYVTLNTILYDSELPEAEALVWELYEAGVDALIVQDLSLLKMNLPPIDLHASTQMDIRTPDKARFLSDAGFSQLVLARELSLADMQAISCATDACLEAFVHGALCVSYSGRCYASEFCFNRSANRGRCAQFCRLAFNLLDADGRVIERNKYFLSLRDMNRSQSLEAMLDAGISSFKVEGRLKDMAYVKNITAYYRLQLDAIINRRPNDFCRASRGSVLLEFQPNPERSFNRGFTEYFLHQRTDVSSIDSPKSRGQYLGRVAHIGRNWLDIDTPHQLSAGDGLCYTTSAGNMEGFRVNRVEGNKVFPAQMPHLSAGTRLYRNQDQAFDRLLARPSATRKLKVDIVLSLTSEGFCLTFTDETGLTAAHNIDFEHQISQRPQRDNMIQNMQKLGNTPFEAASVSLPDADYFLPASLLADARRMVSERLIALLRDNHQRRQRMPLQASHYVEKSLNYSANVANSEAASFYKEHGVETISPAFELQQPREAVLMECRHCLRYVLGFCSKQGKRLPYREPLQLQMSDGRCFPLQFDCARCEMHVLKPVK